MPVSLTNQSKPCDLNGFPGATLEAAGTKVALPTLKGAKAQKLRLAKGDAASFTVTYVRGKAGDKLSLAATKLVVTLPGSSEFRLQVVVRACPGQERCERRGGFGERLHAGRRLTTSPSPRVGVGT